MNAIAAGDIAGYFNIFSSPVSSSAMAFVSTLHVALALLRKERSFPGRRIAPLALPSFALAAAPWLLPSIGGLLVGMAAHLAWFAMCEKLLPRPAALPSAAGAFAAAAKPMAFPAARPAPAREFTEVEILATLDETRDIRTFRLERPRGFEFRPGQFLLARVPTDTQTLVRCYSISSAPEAGGYLEISVKRQGAASGALHDRVRPGSRLAIRGPAGGFVYPDGDDRAVVLLAGGVGITPLMSMLRHALATEPSRPICLLLSARTESDLPFREELALLSRRHTNLRLVLAATRGSGSPGIFPGRIDGRLIRSVVAAPAESLHFICGPGPMVEAMRHTLSEIGVPPSQVCSEAFEAAIAWSARAPGAGSAVAGRPQVLPPPAARLRLALARTGATVPLGESQTLLEAAEGAGARIEYSCRSGICGTCRTRLLRGEIEDGDASLEESERREGWILPCVSFARTDCTIEA